MPAKWVEQDGRYRRVLRGKAGDVYGTITQVGDSYRWQASAYVGVSYGWSRTVEGAKRQCGRAMRFFWRWIEEVER